MKRLFFTPKKVVHIPASATVEAAFVFPIFIYAVMSLIYLLIIVSTKMQVEDAVFNSIRKIAKYSYAYEQIKAPEKRETQEATQLKESITQESNVKELLKKGANAEILRLLMIDELGKNFAKNRSIVGDNIGWSYMGSSILDGNSKIDIKLNYIIKNPFDIFGISYVRVSDQYETFAWLGEDKSGENSLNTTNDKKAEKYVYIADNSRVYHLNKYCTYLSRNIMSADVSYIWGIRNSSGGKFYECERCSKEKSQIVYYTLYGNRYHSTKNCTQLSRNIITVPYESVEGWECCSKCNGK